ncbi:polysaccharide lyase 6 family protein [Jiulongibacter sediminis]|uniref:polysaccharide lyase 6 family protein n=1 Tax=Jiulongibacter sediminis TaxID=1605367 RepID=UPI0026F2895C|nr:polysaccharide lyase 6 family protein [Jiulongibacter sediminis]
MSRLLAFPFLFISLLSLGSDFLVKDESSLKKAISESKAGDNIIMANGSWRDIEILFEATGTQNEPITLKAETKGQVIITGQSNLRLAGSFLQVEGLVFKNGNSPTTELISFRKHSKTLAYNSRLTECVIDNFNGLERFNTEAWVVLYGKHNRVDHCQFIDKRNQGVTLIVRLNGPESVENFHRVDHNYFGYRQNLGSNGGETLRIGTSHYSMMNSNTTVEYNYFDRCNGEHEIISNKSNQNTYRYNTFFESKGTLTMRHGNETLVEGNVFFGNGVAHTGGIRIINEKQTVRNNYLEGLTGDRFRGALTIMNGVPNSPLNRYVPVKESIAEHNTFINCEYIELCAGSDEERSAIPQSTTVSNNLFYQNGNAQKFGVYDELKGISFSSNVYNTSLQGLIAEGFEKKSLFGNRNENGLLIPTLDIKAGAHFDHEIANRDNTGVNWYPKQKGLAGFGSGKVILVSEGLNTLSDAVSKSEPGDVIQLSGGKYNQTKVLSLPHPLSFESTNESTITYENAQLFIIENGASLKLKGLKIDGKNSLDAPLNSVISTSRYSMDQNYKVTIEDCDFTNLDVNHSYNVLKVAQSTFADTISIRNTRFKNISGTVLLLNAEKDDIGIYNAETVLIENCLFEDIEGAALKMYRGGSDESTTAGLLNVNHCEFKNIGHGKKNKIDASIELLGVQNTEIANSLFDNTKPVNVNLTVGEPKAFIHDICLLNTPEVIVIGEGYSSQNIYETNSSCINGSDGESIGILK